MVASGILDPVKVPDWLWENAVSVAMMLLTTEAVVVEAPKKDDSAPQMPGGMGGMGAWME